MTQSSIDVINGSGLEIRTEINDALRTLATNFGGSSAPNPTYGGQFWVDTSTASSILKMRDSANTSWLEIGTILNLAETYAFQVTNPTNILTYLEEVTASADLDIPSWKTTKDYVINYIRDNVTVNIPSILTKFAVNSGLKTNKGEPNYVSFTGSAITLASGIMATNASGKLITTTSNLVYNNAYTTGDYWLYLNEAGTAISTVNKLFIQPFQPTAVVDYVWLDTSVEPLVAYFYNSGAQTLTSFKGVVFAHYGISSSTITYIDMMDFNENFYNSKDRVVLSHGTMSTGTLYARKNRYQEVTLSGGITLKLPVNLPPLLKHQFVFDIITTVASPSISYSVTPTWVFGNPASFGSTTVKYRLTLETKDGGTNYDGFVTQVGA